MADLFDITHGPGGLWEVHKWNNDLELNTEIEAGEGNYLINKITGLNALADIVDNSTKRVGRPGENFNPSSPGGKTVTYDGEIRELDVPSMRLSRTSLIAAFSNTRAEGYMDLIPQVPVGDNSPTARFFGKVLQLDPPEEISSYEFKRNFLLGLRLTDPRIYFPSLAVDETGNPAVVTNPGNAEVEPLITVAGASGDVTITDGTRTLTFRNCPAGSLAIDFAKHIAKVGSTPVELVTPSSDWWDSHVPGIDGGATVSIAQTGGTGVRVQFTPAVWG